MAIRRYARTRIFGLNGRFGTSYAIPALRENILNGNIRILEEFPAQEGERLDIIAGKKYGNAKLFWIIASASNIGFCAQVPPGTLIRIPSLEDVVRYVGS